MTKNPEKRTILFLDTGDNCRCPMAHGYLLKLLAQRDIRHVEIRTAGVMTPTGLLPQSEVVQLMHEEGIDIRRHRSHPLNPDLIRWADLVLGMTPFHVQTALRLVPEARGKVFLLKEYVGFEGKNVQIQDPMGATMEIFKKVFGEIRTCLHRMVEMEIISMPPRPLRPVIPVPAPQAPVTTQLPEAGTPGITRPISESHAMSSFKSEPRLSPAAKAKAAAEKAALEKARARAAAKAAKAEAAANKAKAAKPAKAKKSTKPAKPAKAKAAKPATAAKVPKPQKAVKRAKVVKLTKVAKPAKSAKPARVTKPVKNTVSAKAKTASKPAKPVAKKPIPTKSAKAAPAKKNAASPKKAPARAASGPKTAKKATTRSVPAKSKAAAKKSKSTSKGRK